MELDLSKLKRCKCGAQFAEGGFLTVPQPIEVRCSGGCTSTPDDMYVTLHSAQQCTWWKMLKVRVEK